MASALIGERFGDYELTALLGEGPIGKVFSARHSHADPVEVAVKIIHADIAGKTDFRHRFPAAAQDMQTLRHEHILRIIHYADHAELPYLVMDQATGGSLATLLPLAAYQPIELIVKLIRQAAEGLAFAHRQGVMHGNLKPSNLLLFKTAGADLTLRLTDLGYLEAAGLDPDKIGANTPYLAPEQWRGDPGSMRGDVYALGMLLYEALTGALPFPATRADHINTPPRPPRELRGELPESLEEIILRCLAKLPGERYESAAELARALSAVTGLATIRPAPVAPLEKKSQPLSLDYLVPLPPHEPALPPPPHAAPDRPRVFVLTEKGGYINSVYLVEDQTMIGRDPKLNDLALDSDAVSPRHLCIEFDSGRNLIIVTDLDSLNGVYLERQRLEANAPYKWDKEQWLYVRPYWLCWRPPAKPENAIVVLPSDAEQKIRSLTLPLDQQILCKVMVRNNGNDVAQFKVRASGELEQFVSEEKTPTLQPGQSIDVALKVNVPAGPECLAGAHKLAIRASSDQYPGALGKLPVLWTVPPFFHSECEIRPVTVRGRTEAKYAIKLRNLGNTPQEYTISNAELDEEIEIDCRFGEKNREKHTQKIILEPDKRGETVKAKLTAPRRWVGSAKAYNISNLVSAEREQETFERTVRFFHKAVFPTWLLIAVPAALIAVWLALPWFFPPTLVDAKTTPEKLMANQPFIFTCRVKNAHRVTLRLPGGQPIDINNGEHRFDEGLPKGNHSAAIIVANFLGQTKEYPYTFKVEIPPIRILIWEVSSDKLNFGPQVSVERRQKVYFRWQVEGAKKLSATGLGLLQPITQGTTDLTISETAKAEPMLFKLVASNGPDVDEESPPVTVIVIESPAPIPTLTLPEPRDPGRGYKVGDRIVVQWKVANTANITGFILKANIGGETREPRQLTPTDLSATICLDKAGEARIAVEAIGRGEGNTKVVEKTLHVSKCTTIAPPPRFVRPCPCR